MTEPAPPDDTEFQLLGLPMSDENADLRARIPFEMLASQFVDDLRHGRKPSVELFARRFPPHAAQIKEVFPVLAMLENARIDRESRSMRRNMPDRFPLTRLGNCELLNEIGRGGMGVVFHARDLATDQHVAVKILPWRVSIVPEWVARFEREAQTAAQLRHKNIVPVYRYGQEDGYCFFVMQLVRGIGLDRIIEFLGRSAEGLRVEDICLPQSAEEIPSTRQSKDARKAKSNEATSGGRLTRTSWRDFAKVAIQATQALRAAHRAGICHNDIKPGNLLLDAEGRVWVTDFGLSQPVSPSELVQQPAEKDGRILSPLQRRVEQKKRTGHTSSTSVGGTLRYMAPERFLGKQSVASDLYSLGATLYELCLQSPPFDHENRDALVAQILEQRPVTPRTICQEIPRSLETIILNCLEKHPSDRYPSADALLADLLRFTRGQSISATRRMSFGGFFRRLTSHLSKRQSPAEE
ncbi:MAG: serine/threonine protein kinase [Planctomycetaceae bacterium]|nr:serine/threonine protein kinase [Planctomycetaceae bacterium]